MQSPLQTNAKQTISLTGKRVLAFLAFGVIGGIVGFLCLVIPLSILAIKGDPTGSGSGYFIFGLLVIVAPLAAAPATLISGLVALPIIDRTLQTPARSRVDYVRFLVTVAVSALVGIGLTWLFAWLIGNNLDKIVIAMV